MVRKNPRPIGVISIISSALIFNACVPEEHALATGVGIGVVTASVYDYPHHDDRPYYYYNNRYYYGGDYRDGYYIYNGQRFRNGHYYKNGYRYYQGHRYSPKVGSCGYYRSHDQYKNYHRPKAHRDVRHKESKRDKRQEKDRKHNK